MNGDHIFPQRHNLFGLTKEEWAELRALRSQNAILKAGRGQHRKCPPYAFTEVGVA
jgi:hypothetical protein